MFPRRSIEFRLRLPGVDLWTTHKPLAAEVCLMFMLLGGGVCGARGIPAAGSGWGVRWRPFSLDALPCFSACTSDFANASPTSLPPPQCTCTTATTCCCSWDSTPSPFWVRWAGRAAAADLRLPPLAAADRACLAFQLSPLCPPAGTKLPHILTSAVFLALPGAIAWVVDYLWRLSREPGSVSLLPAWAGLSLGGSSGAAGGGNAAGRSHEEIAAEARALAVLRASGGEAERAGGAAGGGEASPGMAALAQAGKLKPFVELAYGELGRGGWGSWSGHAPRVRQACRREAPAWPSAPCRLLSHRTASRQLSE